MGELSLGTGPLVCCVDDSEGARQALRVATHLGERLGLELLLVHVEPRTEVPGVSAATGGQERLHEAESRDAADLIARLVREAGLDPKVRRRTAIGDPAERIVAICDEEDSALVVLGSRGRGNLSSALLGSVSNAVAAKAGRPCVVVPPPASAGR